MDIINNLILDIKNIFGFAFPIFLGIYSLIFLGFYFIGLNKFYLRFNITLLFIFLFVFFMLANFRGDNIFTTYFISSSDTSLAGTFGQKFQLNSILKFYITSSMFLLLLISSKLFSPLLFINRVHVKLLSRFGRAIIIISLRGHI